MVGHCPDLSGKCPMTDRYFEHCMCFILMIFALQWIKSFISEEIETNVRKVPGKYRKMKKVHKYTKLFKSFYM